MPQRVNAKADIGNSKIASDAYDTNNIFLTDQGWVYRHWKGEPTTGRFWDEILVAGQVDPDNAAVASTDVTPTQYYRKQIDVNGDVVLDGDGNPVMELTDRRDPDFYRFETGNIPYPEDPGNYEPNGTGSPDDKFDVQYSAHTENDTAWVDSGPDQYVPANLVDAEGNVVPPGLPQFPVVDGYETPGVSP